MAQVTGQYMANCYFQSFKKTSVKSPLSVLLLSLKRLSILNVLIDFIFHTRNQFGCPSLNLFQSLYIVLVVQFSEQHNTPSAVKCFGNITGCMQSETKLQSRGKFPAREVAGVEDRSGAHFVSAGHVF
uniref:Uncharacterized protein n=1 Tax=Anguilla anguilla TaxID=7936 RepID=A0A0E9WDC8_ANGAN